jgi:uncharacterized coiled-coil protein SlyX
MNETIKTFWRDNQALVFFLVAQLVGFATAGLTLTAYMVRLESRVSTLEVRGSPHLAEINNRLTTTEKETDSNKARIDRIVDIMTRELGIRPK